MDVRNVQPRPGLDVCNKLMFVARDLRHQLLASVMRVSSAAPLLQRSFVGPSCRSEPAKGGGWGGKGAGQGEHRLVLHEPDTERGTSVPRIERCAAAVIGRHDPRQEPYALTRPYGSARGAISDDRPYRDSDPMADPDAVSFHKRHLTSTNGRALR